MAQSRLSVLSVLEAYTVTGPAKNLIRFAASSPSPAEPGGRPAHVSIATFYRGNSATPDNAFIAAVRSAGLDIDVIVERFRFDPRIIYSLARVLREHSPHIVQTHGIKAHFLVWAARLYRGRRWIAFHHGYTNENAKMQLYNRLNRLTLRDADRVVTVCRPFAGALQRIGVAASRIEVVPNAVEAARTVPPERVAQLRAQMGIASGERVALTAGRFSTEKGQADLIPAMAHLMRLYPHPVRCVLLGNGLERPNVEREIRAAGLAKQFLLPGHVSDIAPYYALADVFVLPSRSEGSANVILEAMSASLPIVATNVGGVPETVDEEVTALLVPPREPEQLAAAMARLLSNPDLAGRLAGAAKAESARRFSPAAYQRALLRIYEGLCPSSPVDTREI